MNRPSVRQRLASVLIGSLLLLFSSCHAAAPWEKAQQQEVFSKSGCGMQRLAKRSPSSLCMSPGHTSLLFLSGPQMARIWLSI
jgi:hypothetical protein